MNNIEWNFCDPKTAKIITTKKLITKDELNTVVFDDSIQENVKFCLPLNSEFLNSETRELQRPIKVKQILKLISDFYKEPLKPENIEPAFQDNEEWREKILIKLKGDVNKLKNYHIFDCSYNKPLYSGLIFDEATGEYYI